MDLETNIPSAYKYTVDEIEKNLALAEVHAKQYGEISPIFCADCLRKHFILIEGLAEEGVNFTQDKNEKLKFQKIAEIMRVFKDKFNKIDKDIAFKMADALRVVRKSLFYDSPKVVEVSTKDLYINDSNNVIGNNDFGSNPTNKKVIKSEFKGENMVEWKEQGTIIGSQLVGRGIQEVVTMYDQPIFQTITLKNVVGIGVGLLGSLAVIYNKVKTAELPIAVISSKLLADEVIDIAKTYVPTAGIPSAGIRAITPVSIPITGVPTGGLVTVD